MMRELEKMEGKKFEVQWYTDEGDYSWVMQIDTIEELAQYLARCCWGTMRFRNNPTVWKDGERWCLNEYTEA